MTNVENPMPEQVQSAKDEWLAATPKFHPSVIRSKPAAELIGTYILVLLGCGAVHCAVLTGALSGLGQVAIAWGVAVTLAIYVVGAISGAHINPAMTIAFAVRGRFSWGQVPGYIAAQLLGAFLAAATLYLLFGGLLAVKEADKGVVRGAPGSIVTAMCYGEYYPNPGKLADSREPIAPDAFATLGRTSPVAMHQAFFAEMFGTMILALVVFAVCDSKTLAANSPWIVPAAIGTTITALISFLAPLTQACFNPARDFGPRLFAWLAGWGAAAIPGPNGLNFLAVYVVAPIVGAALGGLLFDAALKTTDSRSN